MAEDMYSRTKLIIGDDGVRRLHNSCVLVFGIGGVGSHCIDALARAGVGSLIIVDSDDVAESNINRQSIAFHSSLGQKKTEVMKSRLLDINPDMQIYTSDEFITEENAANFITQYDGQDSTHIDYIADCIDTVSAKLTIIEYASSHNIPIISCMGTGGKLHPEMFEIADISQTSVCPLCRVMRKELRDRHIEHVQVLYSKETPTKVDVSDMSEPILGKQNSRPVPGSISFVPPVAGMMIAGAIIRDIAISH